MRPALRVQHVISAVLTVGHSLPHETRIRFPSQRTSKTESRIVPAFVG